MAVSTHAQKNVSLGAHLTYSERLADIWGYTDTTGQEYSIFTNDSNGFG